MKPVLQVALDFVNLKRALRCAEEAISGGVDWIEAGTPLIKSEGLDAVRALRKRFGDRTIVADMKTMDAGRIEVEIAAKAGADVVCVLAAASESTIKECVEAAHNYGARIQADLIAIKNPVEKAKIIEKLGVDIIGVHCAIDEQMRAKDPFRTLKDIANTVRLPIAVAGGINSETAHLAVKNGASIIIVGGALTKSQDAKKAAKAIKRSISKMEAVPTSLYKRVNQKELSKIIGRVSTANISDAMHRGGAIEGLVPVSNNRRIYGPALTVRTYPGDWSKTVQAIDRAEKGDVIVIDAGGLPPAVWGELATHAAIQKKISGVIIDGAIRDTAEIMKLGFPAYAKLVTPRAGEPKGFGEIGVPVSICGKKVFPGDYIVGDEDGIVVIQKEKLVEVLNRSMNVLEAENRLRKEIDAGSTLARVTELLRWEKR